MRGKLTWNGFAQTMPVHADPLSFTNASFRGVNQVTFSYRTNADAAAALLPADLEIEQDPKVSVMFLSYAFSSVGPFGEYIHIIHARFRGEEVGFVPHIFISNERGMLAGREREGYPKLLGEIDFDMNQSNVYGLVTARLSRPAGLVRSASIADHWSHSGHCVLQLRIPAAPAHGNLSIRRMMQRPTAKAGLQFTLAPSTPVCKSSRSNISVPVFATQLGHQQGYRIER
jgi:hypothetical protein